MHAVTRTAVFLVLTLCSRATIAAAQEQKLDPGDLTEVEEYGTSVAIDGSELAVGAPGGGDFDVPGRVVVWRRNVGVWEVEASLLTSEPPSFMQLFGSDVAIQGDVLVGSNQYGGDSGRAYVFERGSHGWSEVQILDLPEPPDSFGFGNHLAFYGNTLVVAATEAVYVYERSGGVFDLVQEIPSAGGWPGGMDLDGDRLAIGFPDLSSRAASQTGAVHLYVRDGSGTFVLEDVIVPSGLEEYARFGQDVALDGTTLVAAAPEWMTDGGTLYVFEESGFGWSQAASFVPVAPWSSSWSSPSVDVRGDRVVLGDPHDLLLGSSSGAVHVYVRDGGQWVEQAPLLVASDGKSYGQFGASVALDDHGILVGSPGWRPGDYYSYGAAYYIGLDRRDGLVPGGEDFILVATILFGVVEGGGGLIWLPGSGPHPVDPEPFRQWAALPQEQRDRVLARTITAYASFMSDERARATIQATARPLAEIGSH